MIDQALPPARLLTDATVVDGEIGNVAQLIDGNSLGLRMFDGSGATPVAVVGVEHSGRTSVCRALMCAAAGTGCMNVMAVAPKGDAGALLHSGVRIVLNGPDAALLTGKVVDALQLGGWMIGLDDFSLLPNTGPVADTLAHYMLSSRQTGLWFVAVNDRLTGWNSTPVRQLMTSQVVTLALCPTDMYHVREFPSDVLSRRAPWTYGHPVRGLGNQFVDQRVVSTAFWDVIDDDAVRRLTAPAPLDAADELAIESVLGPAVGGRWVVGPGGTHEVPA